MKFPVGILLFGFFIFLSTPTIVSFIEENNNTSLFYSNIDFEDLFKDVKMEFTIAIVLTSFFCQSRIFSKILAENSSKCGNIFKSIFIVPPDLI